MDDKQSGFERGGEPVVEHAPVDRSTVAVLAPGTRAGELHYRKFQQSVRLHGSHYMTLRRVSRIPESARRYVHGDPINLIDWKAYARTDQLLIREVRDEATARVRIVVDTSATMHWPDVEVTSLHNVRARTKGPMPTKAEIAMRIALHLAHAHLRMGDLVEIWHSGDELVKIPANVTRPRSPADLLSAFERMSSANFSPEACAREFVPAAFIEKRADVAFYVGDALSMLDRDALLELGGLQVLVHVLSSLELDVDWLDNDTSYFDPGAGPSAKAAKRREAPKKEYQGQVLKQRGNYGASLTLWCERLEHRVKAAGGYYACISDATPLVQYLRFLSSLPKEGTLR